MEVPGCSCHASVMHPQIVQFDPTAWPVLAAALIQKRINSALQEHGQCNVMLTGGRSAERLYTAWRELGDFRRQAGVGYYFGDERCVQSGHPESNYGLAMRTLFRRGVSPGCSVFRMEADDPDRDAAARRYDEMLPDDMDLMILSVGEDGHIASLFPGAGALRENRRRVIPVTGPKWPHDRLTITPPVIARAKSIVVLAAGAAKADVLRQAMQATTSDFDALPARLVLNATWVLDTPWPP